MKSVGLIGFGRFGKVLANILQKGFAIKTYDLTPPHTFTGVEIADLTTVLKEEVIFIAVPIRHFESVIQNIASKLSEDVLVIELCSVKKYTTEVMKKILPEQVSIIATHPMFGPDSYFSNNRLKMMMDNTRDHHNQFSFWI